MLKGVYSTCRTVVCAVVSSQKPWCGFLALRLSRPFPLLSNPNSQASRGFQAIKSIGVMLRPRSALRALSLNVAFAATLAAEPAGLRSSRCRLLLVRHGETNFNADGRLQGRLESELTPKGHEQALALGRWLAANEASTVSQSFVSARHRTQQTLSNVETHAQLPPAEVRWGLREIELTMWEGQYRTELRDATGKSDAERWAEWKRSPASFVFAEDGHSPLGDLKRRASEEWTALLAATPAGSTSLVVAHGAFNRVFLLTALGLPVDDYGFRDEAKRFDMQNCAVIEVEWTPGSDVANAWRQRYPTETPWATRAEEEERRAQDQGSKPPPLKDET